MELILLVAGCLIALSYFFQALDFFIFKFLCVSEIRKKANEVSSYRESIKHHDQLGHFWPMVSQELGISKRVRPGRTFFIWLGRSTLAFSMFAFCALFFPILITIPGAVSWGGYFLKVFFSPSVEARFISEMERREAMFSPPVVVPKSPPPPSAPTLAANPQPSRTFLKSAPAARRRNIRDGM